MKDTHVHKNHRKVMTVLLAAGLTLVLACAASLALYPSQSGARYAESEVYEGTEIYTETEHGNHTDWVNLNATYSGTTSVTGVSWSGTTCTISAGGKYFLSNDLTANIVVTAEVTREESGDTGEKGSVTAGEVIFCLDGYCLTCAAENTSAVTIGSSGSSYSTESDVVFSLYDCGGGKGVYYYKYRGYAECDGETYPTGYEFDSSLKADTCDGYVRGGLITGAVLSSTSSNHYGGGVTVGYGCTFKMYGGTIAGNAVTASNDLSAGVYVDCGEFDMYGGMIAGNSYTASSNHYGSGAGVGLDTAAVKNVAVTMNMYGGEIKENYKASSGGGICAYHTTGEGDIYVKMYGGSVSENFADGAGGGVYISANGSSSTHHFLMYGGTVRDNVAADGNGGGVLIQYTNSNAENLQVLGGAIYGNRAYREGNNTPYGGGLYLGTQGGVTLGGKAYIYGNYAGGKVSNLDLYSGSTTSGASSSSRVYITLSSALEEGARVGVTQSSYAEGKLTVTGSSTTTYNYIEESVSYIISDDRSCGVQVAGTSGGSVTSSSYLELYTLT